MRSTIGSVIFGWLCLGTWCVPASADGGLLRLAGKTGRYQISVFSEPTPLRAGPVDISVLLQDASSGDLVTQARAIVRMSKAGRPALEYPATFEAATNKLFRAAQFNLPERGHWDIQVEVESARGRAVIAGELDVAEALPRWRELWPWIGWPALAIILFLLWVGGFLIFHIAAFALHILIIVAIISFVIHLIRRVF